MNPLPITIFSDFTCPASYVTEAALWKLSETEFEVRYRAFELFPAADGQEASDFSEEEWAGLKVLAEAEGVTLTRRTQRPNTRKAHEAARFARERQSEVALRRELFAAFWAEGKDIGRIDILTSLAPRFGVDSDDLRIALDIDTYRDAVLADEELARRLRIPGTPVLFIGDGSSARIVTGARGGEELRAFIDQTQHDRMDRIDNG